MCRKNGKGSKRSKSNEELCNELREFMLVKGLPGNHVPTTKELLQNGRLGSSLLVVGSSVCGIVLIVVRLDFIG